VDLYLFAAAAISAPASSPAAAALFRLWSAGRAASAEGHGAGTESRVWGGDKGPMLCFKNIFAPKIDPNIGVLTQNNAK
jgi:hypothetical protein